MSHALTTLPGTAKISGDILAMPLDDAHSGGFFVPVFMREHP